MPSPYGIAIVGDERFSELAEVDLRWQEERESGESEELLTSQYVVSTVDGRGGRTRTRDLRFWRTLRIIHQRPRTGHFISKDGPKRACFVYRCAPLSARVVVSVVVNRQATQNDQAVRSLSDRVRSLSDQA